MERKRRKNNEAKVTTSSTKKKIENENEDIEPAEEEVQAPTDAADPTRPRRNPPRTTNECIGQHQRKIK